MDHTLKTNIITSIFAVGCLLCYFFIPVGDLRLEIFSVPVIFLFILPLLYNKYIIKKTAEEVGFGSWRLARKDVFLLVSSVLIGGIIGFFTISMQWGLEQYINNLTPVMFVHFGAFAIYELVFMTVVLSLFTFFAWGFVYAIPWQNRLSGYGGAIIIFFVLMTDFYSGFFIIIPFIIPIILIMFLSRRINITYLFIIFFAIHLIIDTLIVTTHTPTI